MSKLRTFIVEDSPIILESLIETLQETAEVDVVGSASDEKSALAWLDASRHVCDVVIVDIFLKCGSGLGVLKGMRLLGHSPDAIVLTNYATADMKDRCEALGAEAVFDKSREIEELLAWFCARRPSLQ